MFKFTSQKGRSGGQQKSQSQHWSEADERYIGDNADHTKLCQANQQHKTADKYYSRHFHIVPQQDVLYVHANDWSTETKKYHSVDVRVGPKAICTCLCFALLRNMPGWLAQKRAKIDMSFAFDQYLTSKKLPQPRQKPNRFTALIHLYFLQPNAFNKGVVLSLTRVLAPIYDDID